MDQNVNVLDVIRFRGLVGKEVAIANELTQPGEVTNRSANSISVSGILMDSFSGRVEEFNEVQGTVRVRIEGWKNRFILTLKARDLLVINRSEFGKWEPKIVPRPSDVSTLRSWTRQ